MTMFSRLIIGASVAGLWMLSAPGIPRARAHGNERGEAKATVGAAHISIDYGRPSLKGRDPLKLLQPGQVWRIGADAPTTIESDADLNFGGTTVPKGKHFLLARLVAAGQWTLVVSTKPFSQYGPSARIAEVPMALSEGGDSVETVTILLAQKAGSVLIEIAWGKMRLLASFAPA